MKKAFGAIDLLISLLITTAIIMVSIKTFYHTTPVNTITPDNINEHVEKTVNDIERMRQETIDYNKKFQDEL